MRRLIRRLGQAAFILGLGAAGVFGLLIWAAMETSAGVGSLVPGLMAAGGVASIGAFSMIAMPSGSDQAEESFGIGDGGEDGGHSGDGDSGGGDSGGGDSGGGDGGGGE